MYAVPRGEEGEMGRSRMSVSGCPSPVYAVWLFFCVAVMASGAWDGTDAEFVHEVEFRNWRFFDDAQGGEGTARLFMGAGNYNGGVFGVPQLAGDGYGLSALCVGAYRGWIDDEEAYRRALALLKTYDTQLERAWFGFYNHWNNFYTGQPDYMSDTSGIDTAWFLCGALLAAEYFKGTELADTANRIYNEVQWRNCQDPKTGYTEFLIITIIGSGSPTYAWNPPDCRNAWNVSTASTNYWAPLFVYQWPQNYVDFRYYRDDAGADHFSIAQDAMKMQRRQCMLLHARDPDKYSDFGQDGWGLTSATASPLPGSGANARYLELTPWRRGGQDEEYWSDSGTLTPIALPACMAHVPELALSAMKKIAGQYDRFGYYSFPNALNTGTAASGTSFQWDANASMDYGANVLSIENYRSGMPWCYFMRHPVVQRGMKRCGLRRVTEIPRIDHFDHGQQTNVWGGRLGTGSRDGTPPRAEYVSVREGPNGNSGRALLMVADGPGDVVHIGLNGTDQSEMDMFSCWVRGKTGKERFALVLQDMEGHKALVALSNCWMSKEMSNGWTRLCVPLKKFSVTGNPNRDVRLTGLARLSFLFEEKGALMVDDPAFLRDDIPPSAPDRVFAVCVDGTGAVRWSRSQDDDVVGYRIWRAVPPDSEPVCVSDKLVSGERNWSDPDDLPPGDPVAYAVQPVDRFGNTGDVSRMMRSSVMIPGPWRDLDYSDGQEPNTLGGQHQAWGDRTTVEWGRRTNNVGLPAWCRICRSSGLGSGFYISLAGASVAGYDSVRFEIRCGSGLENIRLGLKSNDGREMKQPVSRYSSESLVDGWSRVDVPLKDYEGVDFERMDNLSFTFSIPDEAEITGIRFCGRPCRRPEGQERVGEGSGPKGARPWGI